MVKFCFSAYVQSAIEWWARIEANRNRQLDTSTPPTVNYHEDAQVHITVTDRHGESVNISGNLEEILKAYSNS